MDQPVDIELPDEEMPDLVQAQRLNDAAMGIVEKDYNGVHASLSMLRRALAINPTQAETWSNLGLVLWRLNRIDEAGVALHRAVDIEPDRTTFLGNLGVFLGAVGNTDAAERSLTKSITIDPENCAAQWDLALLYLRQGDWKRGLQQYDIRRKHRGPRFYPELPAPMWKGEDLNGKTIFIQGEQGVGDRFLFSRYLTWIKDTWPDCRIMAGMFDTLTNLFWEYRYAVEMLPNGVPYPENLDYATFLLNLPERHGTSLDNVPADPGLLLKRVLHARKNATCNMPKPALPSLKVGLVWTGNPEQVRNLDRTIPLEMLLPLTEDPRLVFYSFQCSPGSKDLHRLMAGDLICDLSAEIEREGWVATGMALMEMDLLISVCTSVPHLAGALNVPTWVMLCADPYWIWARSGDTTPWYPGLRLFRQRKLGEWQPVIDEVRAELAKLADVTLSQ